MLHLTGGRTTDPSDRRLAAGLAVFLGLLLLFLATYKPERAEAVDPRVNTTRVLAQLEAVSRRIDDLASRLEEDRAALELRQRALTRVRAHGGPEWVVDAAWDEAVDAGVPPEIGFSVIDVESDWDVDEVHENADGSFDYGPMQINERLTKALGLKDPLDPRENLRAGMRHLAYLCRKYGDWHKALTAYNRGEHGLEVYVASRGTARSAYSETVLGEER